MKVENHSKISLYTAVLIFFALLHLLIVCLNHYYYKTDALDYAVYNFAFFDFAHFRLSPVPCYIFPFPANFMQDHFSLTLIFLSPFYWILTPFFGTYSLLILQWAFIVWGAHATHQLILRMSGRNFLAIAAFIYYFVLFGRYSAYRADVNLAIIGSALIPVFLNYFLNGKKTASYLVFAALLLNREDYALWFIFICVFLAIYKRHHVILRNRAIIMSLISLAFFFLLISVLIPAMENENKKYALFDFSVVGETPLKAFLFIISHPVNAIRYLFVNHSGESYHDMIKADFYYVYLISGGFLILIRPWFAIPLIPILLKKMYDDNPLRWSSESYYSIEFVSLMPVLVFLVLITIKSMRIQNILALTICILSAGVCIYKMLIPPGNPIVGESNKYNVVSPAFYKSKFNDNALRNSLALIPPEAPVSASSRLLPHLAFRKKVYYFPKINDAEYVVLIRKEDAYPLLQADFDLEVNKLQQSGEWKILTDEKDVILLKRL